jgi:hypothetical protein
MKAFPNMTNEKGMDLRDYFAAKAMQGLLSDPNVRQSWDKFAEDAYEMADAMMKVREGK